MLTAQEQHELDTAAREIDRRKQHLAHLILERAESGNPTGVPLLDGIIRDVRARLDVLEPSAA